MPRIIILTLALASMLNALPSFPGAEGFGAQTPGGRGGRVIAVTTLASDGPGSLRAALQATGPRIIVFKVSGVIDLQPSSQWELNQGVDNSYVTVAGQTSPGGITLKSTHYGRILHCYQNCRDYGRPFHDGIFRFLRFRATTANLDAVTLTYSHDFIFDHCDFSGANDEALDLTHDSIFTVQWSTISNSAGDMYGTGGGKGSLIAYQEVHSVSLHHNLWAHHYTRGPHMHWKGQVAPHNGLVDYCNNVCYNFLQYSFNIFMAEGPFHLNVVGNTFIEGSATEDIWRNVCVCPTNPIPYHRDNCWEGAGETRCSDNDTYLQGRLGGASEPNPWPMPAITTHPRVEGYNSVLAKAGALPHDPMNLRTAGEVKNRTGALGKINDAALDVSDAPPPPADADMDGMPDFWEEAMGFNKNDYDDNTGDHDGDGYTNIEEYLNDLALARLCEDHYNPVYPIPNNWTDYNPDCSRTLAVESGLPANVDKKYDMGVSPNPFVSGLLTIELPFRAGEIRVVNVQGRLIRTLAGEMKTGWDGKDNGGKRIAGGVYHLYWMAEGRRNAQKKVIVIR